MLRLLIARLGGLDESEGAYPFWMHMIVRRQVSDAPGIANRHPVAAMPDSVPTQDTRAGLWNGMWPG
jgi:hypothetical protein